MSIYLDNNATTKPLDEVVEVVAQSIASQYANPSSQHTAGFEIRKLIEDARLSISNMINASSPEEIIFTSGGTESITQSFYAAMGFLEKKISSIVISAVEHTAVLKAAESYKTFVDSVITISVDSKGQLHLHELEDIIAKKSPVFVSLIYVNNETGVIFPINKISEICKKHGTLLHIDAVQAAGKLLIDVQKDKCDYLSISGHKFYGPKGIGALYIRSGVPRRALIRGHQENNGRGGTENVPGIIGMAIAAKAVTKDLQKDSKRISCLRNKLEKIILTSISGSNVNGDISNRLCNTTNISFQNKDAAMLVERLSSNGIYVSAGAACTTGGEPSHVLQAMGISPELANASLRFSIGKFTTNEEIDIAGKRIPEIINSCIDVYSIK